MIYESNVKSYMRSTNNNGCTFGGRKRGDKLKIQEYRNR